MANIPSLSCVEIDAKHPAKNSVIWLHGLGADGHDFVPIVNELTFADKIVTRFIFPHAPIIPITINAYAKMRAWFDIISLTAQAAIDHEGIATSSQLIHSLITQEMNRGIASHRIILAGFSQGAVMALTVGLSYPQPLGGLLALSGFLPNANSLLKSAPPANQQTPIFLAHGTQDPIVPYAFGKAAYSALQTAHYPVTWHDYVMPHAVCPQEIQDISDWFEQVLAKNP